MPKVFISHSAKDRAFVEREIIALLNQHGIETWYSRDNIQTTARWEKEVLEGLKACDWFLVVMTPDAVASEWVSTEVHWAFNHRKGRVVPVLRSDCNPEELHLMLLPIQYIDFRSDLEPAQKKLLALWGAAPTPEKLYEQAQAACTNEDWATAITKLQSLLQVQPNHAEAAELLQQAQRQQDLTTLYTEGLAHLQAKRWREAFAALERVQELDDNYKDVAQLVADAQEQLIAARINVLFQEADAAAASENWPIAIKKLEEILSVKPEHTDAQQKLHETRRQQHLAWLYEVGRKLHREGRWADALANLYVVRGMAGQYKDVEALIAEAETQQQLEQAPVEPEDESANQAQAAPAPTPTVAPATPLVAPAPPTAVAVTQPAAAATPTTAPAVAPTAAAPTHATTPALTSTPTTTPTPAPPVAAPVGAPPASAQTLPSMFAQPGQFNQRRRLRLILLGVFVLLVIVGLSGYLINQFSTSNTNNSAPKPTPKPTQSDDAAIAARYNRTGVDLFSQGKYREAEDSFRQATELYPYNAQYFVNLGNSLKQQNKWDDAAEQYRAALRIDPDNREAQTNLKNVPLR